MLISSTPKITKNQLKRRAVKLKFISATIHLLENNTFDEISAEDIATQAGFSRRTFFRYFSSKEDIVFSWVEGVAEDVSKDILNSQDNSSPRNCLESAMLTLSEKFELQKHALKPLTRSLYDSPSLRGRMLWETIDWEYKWAYCLQGKYSSLNKSPLFFQVLTATVMAAYITGIRSWANNNDLEPARASIEKCFSFQSEI